MKQELADYLNAETAKLKAAQKIERAKKKLLTTAKKTVKR